MSNYQNRGPYPGPPVSGQSYGAPPSANPGAPAFRPPTGGPAFINPSTGSPAPPSNPMGVAPQSYGTPGYGAPQMNGPPPGVPGYGSAQTSAYGAPPSAGPSYGAPSAQGYSPPPSISGPPSYGAPQSTGPPTYGAPPNAGPPAYGAPNAAYGAPPSAGPPAYGIPNAPVVPPAPKSIPFFSTGGAPASISTNAPPAGYSGMAPPPISTTPTSMNMPPPPGTSNFITPPGQYSSPQGPIPGQPGVPGLHPPPPNLTGLPGYDPQPQQTLPLNSASTDNLNAMAGGAVTPGGAGAPLPTLEEVDFSIVCNPNFMRTSVSKIVGNQALANSSRVPIGLVCRPMWNDKGTKNDDIELVDFGSTGIVRCKRCRTYINPYVAWTDNGRRWRCNICGMLNDVPSTYFSHLDAKGQRRDRDQRPELSKASVEFVAPGDYMVRPPQPPVYFFVVDVSEPAISSGMLQSMVNAIKSCLDDLPGSPRTQIGFITFDTQIHFYNLKSTLSAPQMLVVSDITDVILPLPEDLLVNLQDSRAVVETLLDTLPSMFKSNSSTTSCMGPAIMAAKRVIQHIGGKLLLFQSTLPSIGEGSLKMRENPRLLGTDKEHTLLNTEDPWYKTNAIEFSKIQVSIDTFLFSSQYCDLATVATFSKYTSGSTYYYPAFFGPRDGVKFEKELVHDLTRATAFEAVMRVRATRGLRFSNFYGNYYIRGTDLLSLPNCTSDSTYSLDIAYDEQQLTAQVITIQAALLYTNSSGERRIRVHTMVLPVINSVSEMVDTLDIDCAMNLLSKQAVDIAQKTGMENARQRIHQSTVDILRAAKTNYNVGPQYGAMPAQQPGQPAAIPNSLLLLPLYSMSLQKSLVLRGGTDVRIDERAFFQQLLLNMDVEESKVFIYPRMFSIHDMGSDVGLPSDNADDDCITAGPLQVRLPAILNLSYERLSSSGIFLLENGHDMFMWIGRGVNPAIISTLFGVQTLEGLDMSTISIQSENSDFSSRVNAVIVALREDRSRHMQLHFIREGDGYAEAYFARYLIEDRANFSGGGLSYMEYHAHVSRAMG